MKYIDEFRNRSLIQKIARQIKKITSARKINIMEVCGTHTHQFYRFGLDKILPPNLKLISGPGCPVCVSSQEYIDQAIAYAKQTSNIIVTFGDMLRLPGSRSTLEKERSCGAGVNLVYSALDALTIARRNPRKKVIFLAVGFETTAPTIALSILEARKEKLKNLFFFSSLKLIPAAMDYLMQDKRLNLSGFLCPGHVSVIIGTKSYAFIPKKYKIGCCIAGFEPVDILEGVYLLMQQIVNGKPKVDNQYIRVVTHNGNQKAQKMIAEVFKVCDASWRGLGQIPQSGLKIRREYSCFDASSILSVSHQSPVTSHRLKKCRCGDILKGLISPEDCPLFLKGCTPDNPCGPCMVSSEGACNAHYRYKK